MKYVLFALVLSSIAASQAAYAACTGPDGVEGEIIYNRDWKVMQFCDNERWIGMGPSNIGLSAAGNIGEIQYNDGSGNLAADAGLNWNSSGELNRTGFAGGHLV